MTLDDALLRMPIIAILRGLTPDEAPAVGAALLEAGVTILELPLNSPEPFRSIEILARRHGGEAIVGAGTVLRPADVTRVAEAGGRIVVSPNFSGCVVAQTKAAGLISVPGVLTPTEAFAALEAGASALKLFPGDLATPKIVGALRSVLPPCARLLVTGGVGIDNLAAFMAAGADGAGVGSALYKPGRSPAQVRCVATELAAAARLAGAGLGRCAAGGRRIS